MINRIVEFMGRTMIFENFLNEIWTQHIILNLEDTIVSCFPYQFKKKERILYFLNFYRAFHIN